MLAKIYKYSMFLGIVAILTGIAYCMNSIVELYIMLISFLIAKQWYKYKFHCKSSLQCLILSVGVFVIALRVTLPLGTSYICSGICGLVIAYVGQYAGESKFIREDYAYIEPRYNALIEEQRKQDVYSLSEDDLRKYCKSFNFDEIDEEIVVQRLIYHLKGKDLYDKIGYSKPQMIRREQRIESILKIPLKRHTK
nr:MAG TPA: accessory gene regulator B [Caudoviricetes sp.]